MEQVTCDYCGGGEYVTVARQTDIIHRTTVEMFSIVSCNGCGLHYLNPRPTRDEIGRYYAEQYSFHAVPSRFRLLAADALDAIANSPLHALFGWIPFVKYKLGARVKPRIADPVLRHIAPGTRPRILDIGCGSGVSAHFWGYRGSLRHYGGIASVCGVEVGDQARRELSNSGIEAFRSIDDIPAAARFDIIRMNWSLEHVHSPSSYFAFIAARLAARGKAVIAVPNYEGLLYRIARDCVEIPIHLFHFRKRKQMHLHAEALRRGGKPLVFNPAVFIVGKPQTARHFPARGKARFPIEFLVELNRIFQHLRDGSR